MSLPKGAYIGHTDGGNQASGECVSASLYPPNFTAPLTFSLAFDSPAEVDAKQETALQMWRAAFGLSCAVNTDTCCKKGNSFFLFPFFFFPMSDAIVSLPACFGEHTGGVGGG